MWREVQRQEDGRVSVLDQRGLTVAEFVPCPGCGELAETGDDECYSCGFTGRCSICGQMIDEVNHQRPQICLDGACEYEAWNQEGADQ